MKDGDINYSEYSFDELLEARESIDAETYPKNFEALTTELKSRSKTEANLSEKDLTRDKLNPGCLQAFGIVMLAITSVWLFVLGVRGLLSQELQLQLGRRFNHALLEYSGHSALSASAGVILISLTFGLTVYCIVVDKARTHPYKLILKVGAYLSIGLVGLAELLSD